MLLRSSLSASASWISVVLCFLALFIPLGGLASLHDHGDVTTIPDAPTPGWSRVTTYKGIVQDDTEFSWDLVRILARSPLTFLIYQMTQNT